MQHAKNIIRTVFLALALLVAGFSVASDAQADATTEPLLQASDITYIGAFRMPSTDPSGGVSGFNYGGKGVTPYHDPVSGKRTLFLQGHAQYDAQVAQIEIPTSFVKSSDWNALPMATVLQGFHDVTDGLLDTAGNTYNGMPVNGMLVYNGKLIVAVTQAYGSNQVASHGVSTLNLSLGNDFLGFHPFASNVVAPPRALGGHMTTIPSEWQTLLGGPALTGNCCRSIIGATSAGPATTIFDPASVGVTNPIPGTTALYYPLTHPACGSANCESTQNNTFNLTTRVEGVAFPSGTRSVLFFGTHGTGPYCYGTAAECNGFCLPDNKGPHAQPYREQVWAYDANDLLAVKNGTLETWQVQPYAMWEFGRGEIWDGSGPCAPFLQGASYDPETGRLYVIPDYGQQPVVHVYQVGAPDTTAPAAPTGLGVN
jgi:hypothetical protein